MAIRPLSISPLQERVPIVDAERRPVPAFIRALNNAFRQIQGAFNDNAALVQQLAILAGIVDAQGDLISDLQTENSNLTSEQSIVNSGVVEEVGVLQAGASGSITVPNHKRRYGNTALNPTVSVAGAGIATSFVADDFVYVYYDDPARAGGVVTYQTTLDPNVTVQTGNRHAVGSVSIPDVGSQNGELLRPRGA